MSRGKGNQRYFVFCFSDDDPEKTDGFAYEIQILDARGRSEMAGCLREGEEHLEIEGSVVPAAVIEAARRQAEGQGDYVDAEGNTISPF